MKYSRILLLVIFSYSFASPLKGLYVSYDGSATIGGEIEATVTTSGYSMSSTQEMSDEDFDTGGLSIGYDFNLANYIAIGASYDVIGMGNDGSDDDLSFINIYGKYSYPTPVGSAWVLAGYNLPSDIGDITPDGGLVYGAGIKTTYGVGVGYIIQNMSYTESYSYSGIETSMTLSAMVSRLTLTYQF